MTRRFIMVRPRAGAARHGPDIVAGRIALDAGDLGELTRKLPLLKAHLAAGRPVVIEIAADDLEAVHALLAKWRRR